MKKVILPFLLVNCIGILQASTLDIIPPLKISIWSDKGCNSNEMSFVACFMSLRKLAAYASPEGSKIVLQDGKLSLLPGREPVPVSALADIQKRNALWIEAKNAYRARQQDVAFEELFQKLLAMAPDDLVLESYNLYLQTSSDGHSHLVSIKDLIQEFDPELEPTVRVGLYGNEEVQGYRVSGVLRSGPAYAGGLRAHDLIVEINGVSAESENPVDFGNLLNQGAENSVVQVKVLRANKWLSLEFKRELYSGPTYDRVILKTPAGNFGYVRLFDFDQQLTSIDLKAFIVRQEHAQEIKGWLIDLRNNSGGLSQNAAKAAAAFIKEGEEIYSIQMLSMKEPFLIPKKSTDVQRTTKPMVVLVDSQTKSAAELFTAALRDNDRALIVGERTFGKGVGQSSFRDFSKTTPPGFESLTKEELDKLSDNYVFFKTVELVASPQVVFTQKRGITPDFEIRQSLAPREEDLYPNAEPKRGKDFVPSEKRKELVKKTQGCMDKGSLYLDEEADINYALNILLCSAE